MNKQVKIGIAASVVFLVIIISVILYTVFIKKEPVDVNDGLKNKTIVESLMLPQVFTPQQNAKIVSDLLPKQEKGDKKVDREKEAEKNAEIIKSLLR